MERHGPLISVLMPARNAQRYIVPAARTVLEQDGCGRDLELIVIDDGSTDKTPKVVSKIGDPRVVVFYGCGQGISNALNIGLAEARGRYIARCDADDLYPPGRLLWQLRWLTNHGSFAAVCGRFSTMNHRGRLIRELDCGEFEEEITDELRDGKTRTHLGTFLIRTEALRRIGGFRDFFITAEDIDVQLRLSEHGRIFYQPEISYHYRLHDGSITHTQEQHRREFFEQAARIFQMQRQRDGVDDLTQGRTPPEPGDWKPPTRSSEHAWGLLMGRAWNEHDAGKVKRAMLTGARAFLMKPFSMESWRNLGALALKKPGAGRAK